MDILITEKEACIIAKEIMLDLAKQQRADPNFDLTGKVQAAIKERVKLHDLTPGDKVLIATTMTAIANPELTADEIVAKLQDIIDKVQANRECGG